MVPPVADAGTDRTVDNVQGRGAENVNQNNPFDGTYKVNVHHYCEHGSGPATATVRVWAGGVLVWSGSKTLRQRQNWDVVLITAQGGRV